MGFSSTILATCLKAVTDAQDSGQCPPPWDDCVLALPNVKQDVKGPYPDGNQFISASVEFASSRRNLINGAGFSSPAGRRHRFIFTVRLFVRDRTGPLTIATGADYFVSALSEKVMPVVILATDPPNIPPASAQVILFVSECAGFAPVDRDGSAWFGAAVHTEGYYDELRTFYDP